jgi:hypothetical protein
MIHDILTMGLLLCGAHWLADYPLQPDFLVKAKIEGPLRVYHLIAHAGIHATMVLLITKSPALALAEWVLHAVIDEGKTKGKISFGQDQALHLLCKLLWLVASFSVLKT